MAGTDHKSNSLKILLLALLLAVQALGHAHAVEHVLDGDNNLCGICSVTGQGGNAIVDSGESDVLIPLQATVPNCQRQAFSRTTARLHHARAPPLS